MPRSAARSQTNAYVAEEHCSIDGQQNVGHATEHYWWSEEECLIEEADFGASRPAFWA